MVNHNITVAPCNNFESFIGHVRVRLPGIRIIGIINVSKRLLGSYGVFSFQNTWLSIPAILLPGAEQPRMAFAFWSSHSSSMSLTKLIFCDRFCYEKYNNYCPLPASFQVQLVVTVVVLFCPCIQLFSSLDCTNNVWTSSGLRTIKVTYYMFWSVKL